MTVKIWRVYANGSIKDETHVLGPHNGFKGYDGDVNAWSEHNKRERFGCAQIMRKGDEQPVILYNGYLSDQELAPILKKLKDQPYDQ